MVLLRFIASLVASARALIERGPRIGQLMDDDRLGSCYMVIPPGQRWDRRLRDSVTRSLLRVLGGRARVAPAPARKPNVVPARSVVIYDLKAECFEYAKAQRSIPRVPGKQFRTLWPFLSIIGYIGLAMVLSVHPAAAATTTGSAGFFQPVVTFVTDFKTTIQLILAPLCFIFWVGTVGSIVANGGQIHGLGWAMLAGALGTTALLVADLIISSFSSGALVV